MDDVSLSADLEKVVENVVSSLQSAEKVIEAAIATVASKEGLTDSARVELTANLEKKAQNIEESIKGKVHIVLKHFVTSRLHELIDGIDTMDTSFWINAPQWRIQ